MPGRAASAGPSFTAVADAELTRVVVSTDPVTLSEELLDPGVVASQAKLTSLGESTAFASNPYPGSLLTTAPGLVSSVLQPTAPGAPALPPLPAYPFYVDSSFPATPSASLDLAGTSLRADSLEDRSRGETLDGADRSVGHVEVDAGGTASADATAEIGAVNVGAMVQVGGVRSTASTQRDASGALHRTSTFTVASATVLGQDVRITTSGLQLATLALPAGGAAATAAVNQLLAQLGAQGVGLRVIPAADTPAGVMSAALELTVKVPDPAVPGGTVTAKVTYGRTLAEVAGTAAPGDAAPATDASTPPGAGTDVGDARSSTSAGTPSGADAVTGSQPNARGGAAQVRRIAHRSARGLVPDRSDGGAFYPVLVVVGLAVVATFNFFRRFGEGMPWNS